MSKIIVITIFFFLSIFVGFFIYGASNNQRPITRKMMIALVSIYGANGLISAVIFLWLVSLFG